MKRIDELEATTAKKDDLERQVAVLTEALEETQRQLVKERELTDVYFNQEIEGRKRYEEQLEAWQDEYKAHHAWSDKFMHILAKNEAAWRSVRHLIADIEGADMDEAGIVAHLRTVVNDLEKSWTQEELKTKDPELYEAGQCLRRTELMLEEAWAANKKLLSHGHEQTRALKDTKDALRHLLEAAEAKDYSVPDTHQAKYAEAIEAAEKVLGTPTEFKTEKDDE